MAEEKKSPHSGHRDRMRQRFLKDPRLLGFAEHEIMEMLLYSVFTRMDTNAVAHDLIDKFGTVREVLNAPIDRLMEVKNIGENGAVRLKLFGAVADHVAMQEYDRVCVTDEKAFTEYLKRLFRNETVERFVAMVITNDMHVGLTAYISKGNTRSTPIDLRELTRIALNASADSLIIAHNHPNTSSQPSGADIALTRQIMQHLAPMGIKILDHYVVGNDSPVSMRRSALLYDIEC